MKTLLKPVLLLLTISIPVGVVLLLFTRKGQIDEREAKKKSINIMDLELLERDDSLYRLPEKNYWENIVLILFNKDCELCQSEIKAIAENINKFEKSQLLFLGPNDPETHAFLQNQSTNLLNLKNVKFLYARSGEKFHYLNIKATPSILIFDSDGNIKKSYSGFYPIESLPL